MQYMVHTFILSGLFVSSQVSGILHHHDGLVIAPVAAADWTKFLIRQRIAFLTVTDVGLGLRNGSRQACHLLLRHIDDVKCQSLGRFASNPRKL